MSWNAGQFPGQILLLDSGVPVLFGRPEIAVEDRKIEIGIDLLGSIFFMLSRCEEVQVAERDKHGRFPASASIAHKAGFLNRPIVDEYVEILWSCMKRLWPNLNRKVRAFRVRISCDVDHPYSRARANFHFLARHVARDAIIHRNPKLAARNLANFAYGAIGIEDYSFDPCFSRIDWMLNRHEVLRQEPITFYFMAGQSNAKFDRGYRLSEPVIQNLLKRIHQRGHDVGVHPSYETYCNPTLLNSEVNALRAALDSLQIRQAELGGRQHYLRWKTPITARAYETAGLCYDTTLSYADQAGFRCGTSQPFSLFDVIDRRKLSVIERPLILMEDTVIDDMGLGYNDAALTHMLRLKESCRLFGGEFTLLWHNSHFLHRKDAEFYAALAS
jgi:hypothetical protein